MKLKSITAGFLLAGIGSAVWLLGLTTSLSHVPSVFYLYRDDAIITLTEAMNFARHGVATFSPGGERVYGFSNPLEFSIASIVFFFKQMHYKQFLDWYVIASVALEGAVLALIFNKLLKTCRMKIQKKLLIVATCTILTAFVAGLSFTATGWLFSGLENPLIILFGLWLIYLTISSSSKKLYCSQFIFCVSLLGLTRSEFPLLLTPVLIAVGSLWWHNSVGSKKIRNLSALFIIPMMTWGTEYCLGTLYFGSWQPSTAMVEGKTGNLVDVIICGLIACIFLLISLYFHLKERSRKWSLIIALSIVAPSSFLIYLVGIGKSKGTFVELINTPYLGALFALASVALWFLTLLGGKINWYKVLVVAALISVPTSQFLVAGYARLDSYRVISVDIFFVTCALAILLLMASVRLFEIKGLFFTIINEKALTIILVIVAICALLIIKGPTDVPNNLCCNIADGKSIIIQKANQFILPKLTPHSYPIVASPDLGELSFESSAMVVDLGWIGDPLLYKVYTANSPSMLTKFMNDVELPDVVEAHGGWACMYSDWLNSLKFSGNYELIYGPQIKTGGTDFCANVQLQFPRIWIRTHTSEEYALARKIIYAKDPVSIIIDEVRRCSSAGGDMLRCEYVRRAIWRDSAFLNSKGRFNSVLNALHRSPSYKLDAQILDGGNSWSVNAYKNFQKIYFKTKLP